MIIILIHIIILFIFYSLGRELDQWLKKMKCNGSNVGLRQFSDIKVL